MSRHHRFFHRRAAQNTRVVTVAVEVVATVDTNGILVAKETMAPVTPQASSAPTGVVVATAASVASAQQVLPSAVVPSAVLPSAVLPTASLPVVPFVPSAPAVVIPSMPSVPAVPPFPTDLTVPAYPFSTGASVIQVAASSDSISASPLPTSAPTSAPESTATPSAASIPEPVSVISSLPLANSTTSSTASLLPSSSLLSLSSISSSVSISISTSTSTSTSSDLIATIADVPFSRSTSASQFRASSSTSSSSASATLTDSLFATSTGTASDGTPTTAYYGGIGESAAGTAGAPAAATTAASADADADSAPSPLETPQVVGSVVGSLAGAALILAIILLLLRRHKRKRGGALQLTGDDRTDNNQSMRQVAASSTPTTASTLVPAAFLHRFSGMSGKTAETSTSAGERSFQRVSGRKLPSAFSEGMTSDQFSRGGTLSGTSFYTDDRGTYGGAGVSKEFAKEIGDTSTARESGQMNIRPSPARTPVIRHPNDNPFETDNRYLSPPQSPNPDMPPRGSLGRSLASQDGSRSSRFTENV